MDTQQARYISLTHLLELIFCLLSAAILKEKKKRSNYRLLRGQESHILEHSRVREADFTMTASPKPDYNCKQRVWNGLSAISAFLMSNFYIKSHKFYLYSRNICLRLNAFSLWKLAEGECCQDRGARTHWLDLDPSSRGLYQQHRKVQSYFLS